MSKTIAWLPVAMVAGGLVGAWIPSEELRALRERGREATVRVAEAPKTSASIENFTSLIHIPAKAQSARPAPVTTNAAAAVAAVDPDAPATNVQVAARRQKPEDLNVRIEEAKALWETRIDMARGVTLARLEIGDEDAVRFDAALAAMNDRLREVVKALADELAGGRPMSQELVLRLMGDAAAAMAVTYDDLGEIVEAERRDEVAQLSLMDFVDPSVAEPLIAVQDRLELPDGHGERGR